MFSASDCWILFSVGFDRKGADLQRIITNGDRINHAIFSRDELEKGLGILLHNGYLRSVGERCPHLHERLFAHEDERFYATPKARQIYKRNRKFFEGSIEELLRFSEILAAMPCENSTVKECVLSEEEYQTAVRAYTKSG